MAARGRPFPKGVSGNPRGMKPGTKNRVTILTKSICLQGASWLYDKGLKAIEAQLDKGNPDGWLELLRLALPKDEGAGSANIAEMVAAYSTFEEARLRSVEEIAKIVARETRKDEKRRAGATG